jgi:hypothetical protein
VYTVRNPLKSLQRLQLYEIDQLIQSQRRDRKLSIRSSGCELRGGDSFSSINSSSLSASSKNFGYFILLGKGRYSPVEATTRPSLASQSLLTRTLAGYGCSFFSLIDLHIRRTKISMGDSDSELAVEHLGRLKIFSCDLDLLKCLDPLSVLLFELKGS